MKSIHLLDSDTINKIAAGEVVERPSSVIKELVENAIDAKASAITIEIKEGGIAMMRVTDNGGGIDRDDIKTAFVRHATSKIETAMDLMTVGSLGFRGEALSSIASVSQIELITKVHRELLGVRYCIDGGEEKSCDDIGCPDGTTIIVRNLFYNTPARKKFLKTAATEAAYINDLAGRLALSHPDVSFKFINNNQNRLHTSGNGNLRDIIYQIYGRDTAAGSVVSFYAFMLMSIPMVHFVRNTISGRRRLVPDVCIALFCANALAQGAAYRLFGIRFIDMLPLTHLLLAAGVAAMLTVLLRSYREQPSQQLRLRIAAFAALGVFGVAALVLYGLLHIYWYDAIFQFGVLLFIILLFRELLGQATEDMRFHMEHRISHQMQREDRMTGLPNRRAFEEYMERIRTGEVGCRDAVLTYIRLEGLNERNDRLGLQAGDEAVIAAARCVADFCRACEDGGESVSCFRTGGNEFALIRPEPRANSGQLHRQFSAIVARYNRTCAPRARITMTYGFSRLCDEDGKSRSISAWKAEADAYLKRNETRLGGDTE